MKLERLRAERTRKFMTQQELADAAGLTRCSITRLEAGTAARPTTVRRLATVLGIEPAALLGERDGSGAR